MLGEVRPIGGHGIGDFQVRLRRLRALGIEMLENVGHIRAVRRAVAKPGRAFWIIRVLVEVIIEDLGFSGLRLKSRPSPSLPAKRRIAGQITRGFRN